MATKTRRRWPWLLLAVALFGVAAWLMSRYDPAHEEPSWRRVDMPRHMRQADRERAQARRSNPPPAPSPPAEGESAAVPRAQDPVLAALPSEVKKGVVVVEANAIRHSPVGELLVECLASRDGGRGLAQMREELGFDPLEAVDRIAIADDALVVSGHFGDGRWKGFLGSEGRPFGKHGTIYDAPRRAEDDADGPPTKIAVWRDELVVVADTDAQAEVVLDRIEGRGLHGAPALDESMTYGEIYGVLSADAFAEAFESTQPELAQRLREVAERIELHVDTRRDVGVVADIRGASASDTKDLGKTVGAALALGRLKAQADGYAELAELMDLARVVPGDGDFRMELGLPLEFLQKHLEECVARNEARRAASEGARAPGPAPEPAPEPAR